MTDWMDGWVASWKDGLIAGLMDDWLAEWMDNLVASCMNG